MQTLSSIIYLSYYFFLFYSWLYIQVCCCFHNAEAFALHFLAPKTTTEDNRAYPKYCTSSAGEMYHNIILKTQVLFFEEAGVHNWTELPSLKCN